MADIGMQRSSEPAEVDNSQTLLNDDDDQCEPHAGPKRADVEAAEMKHDMQTTNDDLIGQLTAENVRTSSTKYTHTCVYLQ